MVERDYKQLRGEAKERWEDFWQENQGQRDIDLIRSNAVSRAEFLGGEDKDFYIRSFKARVSYQEKQRFINKIQGTTLEETWRTGADTQKVSLSRMAGQLLKLEREIRQEVRKEGITDVEMREEVVDRAEQILAVSMLGLIGEKPKGKKEKIHNEIEKVSLIIEKEKEEEEVVKKKEEKKKKLESRILKIKAGLGLMAVAILLVGSISRRDSNVDVINQADLDNKENQPKATAVFPETVTTQITPTSEAKEIFSTSTAYPTAEIITFTPEAPSIPENPFKIEINGAEIDFSQPVKVRWPWGLKKDKKDYIDFWTDPMKVLNENTGDSTKDDREIFLQVQKDWINRPSLVGLFRTIFEKRFQWFTHSGKVKVKPETLGDLWERDWELYFPHANNNEKQWVNLPFQALADYGVLVEGKPQMINDQVFMATEAKVVDSQQWANTCEARQGQYFCEIRRIDMIESWNQPGITEGACFGEYNKQTESYPSRIVVSYESVPTREYLTPEALQRPAVREAVGLAEYINKFSFRDNKNQTIEQYIQNGQWYQQMSEINKKAADSALTIVESGSHKFNDPLVEGIQCVGWEVLRTDGQVKADKDPGLMVPQEVKILSDSTYEVEKILDGRKWTTGENLDYRNIGKGMAVMMWGTGAIRESDGKDSGHTAVAEDSWVDASGITHTVFSEANTPKYPGMVILYEITSQEEFNQTFGTIKRAVLAAVNAPITMQAGVNTGN